AMVTIGDADTATVAFQSASSTKGEGEAAAINVALGLAPGVTLERDVTFNATDTGTGTADFGDSDFFAPIPVTFAAGSSNKSMQTVTVNLTSDHLIEGPETLVLGLEPADPQADAVKLGAITTHTLNIADADTGTVSFEVDTNSVTEGGLVTVSAVLNAAP